MEELDPKKEELDPKNNEQNETGKNEEPKTEETPIDVVDAKPNEEQKEEKKEELKETVEEQQEEAPTSGVLDLSLSKDSQPEEQEKPSDKVEIDSIEGTYTKHKDTGEKAVYVTPSGKVDGVNVTLFNSIEEARVKCLKTYKKNKLPSSIALGVFAVFLIVTIIIFLLFNTQPNNAVFTALLWTFVALAIVSLVVYTVFNHFSKKKAALLISDYLNSWTDSFVSYTYVGQRDIENISYAIDGKVDDWSIIKTHYFATIDDILSRSHVVMEFMGKALCDSEVSISVPPYSEFVEKIAQEKVVENQTNVSEVVFADLIPETTDESAEKQGKKKRAEKNINERMPTVGGYGKFLSYDVKASDPSSYLIVVRKVKDSYLPTNVHGFTRFDNLASELLTADFVIWASDEEFVRSVLTEIVRDELKRLTPNNILLDYFFAFNKDEAAFLLNYSSAIMELPFYRGTPAASLEEYPEDVRHVLNVFRNLRESFPDKDEETKKAE